MAVSDYSILYKTWALAEEEHLDYCLLYSKKNYFVADAELRKTDLESRINQKTFPKRSNTAQKIMFSIY